MQKQNSSDNVRFDFGKNWERFLSSLDQEKIGLATDSLQDMLEIQTYDRLTFLDIGSGSGLSSLAAMQLGAKRVHSLDYDLNSVTCAKELKQLFYPNDTRWTIEHGDALNSSYLQSLGQWDIVYSWGVLHHTGNMWQALENVSWLVAPGGYLWIAIYNDQGTESKLWLSIKKLYNRLPENLRFIVLWPSFLRLWTPTLLRDLLRCGNPLHSWMSYSSNRGMSPWHDVVDWVGGYPFEVAKPEKIFNFYRNRNFTLQRLTTMGGGLGNNEFVFRREKIEKNKLESRHRS